MEQPEGFKIRDQENKVLHALYRLKQAALAWWKELDKSMAVLGCKRLQSDSGLFVHKSKNSTVIVIVYVDDALFIGSDRAQVDKLKAAFMCKWECCDLGDIKEFLCMCIKLGRMAVSI